jgi:hypothetical protein
MPYAAGRAPSFRLARVALPAAALAVLLVGPSPMGYTSPCLAAPEPDPVPKRWELNIAPGPLRVATINLPGVGPRTYFYFTYKAVNNTGDDLLFAPSFELSTEQGDLIHAGRDVPSAVTEEVLRQLDNPFLQDQINVIGQILQGEENAKEGLVIWPVPTVKPGQVTIYSKGFSGETKTIDVPNKAAHDVTRITLSKQYMLRYFLPGELDMKDSAPLGVTERRWIMR